MSRSFVLSNTCCSFRSRQIPFHALSNASPPAFRTSRGLDRLNATGSESSIKNLSKDYCDEFQCNSSPAVELCVRSYAQCTERCTWGNRNIFAEKVSYSDGQRKFTGRDGYKDLTWEQDNLENYQATVTNMEMLENDKAKVEYMFTGKLLGGEVRAKAVSMITLNVLTGRVVEHEESVDLSETSFVTAGYFKSKRGSWAISRNLSDISDSVNNALDSLSVDDTPQISVDPNDPNKFFQDKDNTFSDAVTYALFLAILWSLVTAFQNLEGF